VELVLVLFGFILLWRQRKIRREFAELDKRHVAQNDALRRELLELRRRVDRTAAEPAAAVSAPSLAGAPPLMPAPEVQQRSTVHLVAEMPAAAPSVAIPSTPPIPEPKPAATAAPPPAAKPVMPAVPGRPAEPPAHPAKPNWLDQPPAASARVTTPAVVAPLRTSAPKATPQQRMKKVFALEEALGTNWLNKLGIIILVLGVALFGIYELGQLGPAGKVSLLYVVSLGLLGSGVWLERKGRYRILGRTLIGGGWALLIFSTYAMQHVPAMQVMTSEATNSFLILGAVVAMALHTLHYRSQLVTGLAFLLAYSTMALSHDNVFSLTSGVILAAGLVAVVLRMEWFELEVFGIASGYLNHMYWLYRLLGPDGAHGLFVEYNPSTALLLFYWLIYRVSYIARKPKSAYLEHVSTAAALLNTVLLLVSMKFQSVHPELAFFALLVIGAVEFGAGQLPITRRRREAFIVLSTLGAALMVAAVPFRYSGNNIAILWLIGGEVLLAAGVMASEVVFRRLGLLIGLLVGVRLLGFDFVQLMTTRGTTEDLVLDAGVMLGLCAVVFYGNALVVGQRWKQFFGGSPDAQILSVHSYLGAFSGAAAVWAFCSGDWTALGFAGIMLALAALGQRLKYVHLRVQFGLIGALTLYRVFEVNLHVSGAAGVHVPARLLTLPVLAGAFYLTALWTEPGDHGAGLDLRGIIAAAGSLLISVLIYFEAPGALVGVLWIAFAVVLAQCTRWLRYRPLPWHADAVAICAILRTFTFNYGLAQGFWSGISLRMVTVVLVAAGLYLIARKPLQQGPAYLKASAYGHSAAATALLALLAWYEAPSGWLAAVWAVFALTLALVDWRWKLDELRWQVHALAALTLWQSVTINLYVTETWHGVSVRLLSLMIVAAVLYALSRLVRLPAAWREQDFHHVYSWAASTIVSLLLWYELQPLSVAVGWAVFGLVLFELGQLRQVRQYRMQAYVALTAAFARLFFANFTAGEPGELWGPRMYTVLPVTAILFYVYWRAGSDKQDSGGKSRLPFEALLAYLGTGSIVALLYFQFPNDWLVTAWAVVVFMLSGLAMSLDRPVFLHQALLLTLAVCGRGIAYNCFGASYFAGGDWTGRYFVLGSAVGILLACLPFAFQLRERHKTQTGAKDWIATVVRRPEQVLFFAPVVLLTVMLALKMRAGMITVAWGIEGISIIVLALAVRESSFRLTGLCMLLLCVAKVLVKDVWRLGHRDMYLTFIILGAALMLGHFLYTKYQETIRQYL